MKPGDPPVDHERFSTNAISNGPKKRSSLGDLQDTGNQQNSTSSSRQEEAEFDPPSPSSSLAIDPPEPELPSDEQMKAAAQASIDRIWGGNPQNVPGAMRE